MTGLALDRKAIAGTAEGRLSLMEAQELSWVCILIWRKSRSNCNLCTDSPISHGLSQPSCPGMLTCMEAGLVILESRVVVVHFLSTTLIYLKEPSSLMSNLYLGDPSYPAGVLIGEVGAQTNE